MTKEDPVPDLAVAEVISTMAEGIRENDRSFRHVLLISTGLFLSVVSWFLIKSSADGEPFYGITSVSEAIVQVGVTLCVALLWAQWLILVCYWCVRGRVNRWWLLSLVLALACIWLMWFCATGYVLDNIISNRGLMPR